MTTLLHIECSPRKQRSASLEIARQFIQRYQQNAPDTHVVTLDVWALDLPEFDGPVMDAKYAGLSGVALSDEQRVAWTALKALAAQLHQADVLVFSVPLWNFAIPYKLKHFIDVVSQKDVLFEFSPEHGLRGLLHNKTAVNVYAPHGLADVEQGVLRINPRHPEPELFEQKARSYQARWPWLKIVAPGPSPA